MRLLLLASLALALAACDTYDNDAYRELVVVEAILEANAPAPPIFLSTTLPLDAVFTADDARDVNDAAVVLERLDAAGAVAETIPYENTADVGRYDPVFDPDASAPTVQPRARYRLRVDVPDYGPVRAETVVPDTFTVVEPPTSPLVYQGPEQPTVTLTASGFPGRQTIYIFSILAAEQVGRFDADALTPLARALYDNEDSDAERRRFLSEAVYGASPLLNEEGYTINADGTRDVPVPWLAFSYYGFHELYASAVDEALNLFLSTQAVQFQPTTLSPGEIPNIASNVEGGLGVFGAYARAATTVTITPP